MSTSAEDDTFYHRPATASMVEPVAVAGRMARDHC
jgi:hypothetical protein